MDLDSNGESDEPGNRLDLGVKEREASRVIEFSGL